MMVREINRCAKSAELDDGHDDKGQTLQSADRATIANGPDRVSACYRVGIGKKRVMSDGSWPMTMKRRAGADPGRGDVTCGSRC